MIVFSGTRVGASATGTGGSDCELVSDRSGIARLWAVPCAAIAGLRFDSERKVAGVNFLCGALSEEWVEVFFEEGTAQFQQSQRGVNRYDQTISLTINGQTAYNRRQINALTSCSCWHFVALDENGVYHYAGIHTYDRGSLTKWEGAGMAATGNVASSGLGSGSTLSEFRLVIVAQGVNQLAPHLTDEPNELTGDCLAGTISFNPPGGDGPTGDPSGGVVILPGEPGSDDNWQDDDGNDWLSDDGSPWY